MCCSRGRREERGLDAGIIAAQLSGASDGLCHVRLARSTWVRPTFQTLSVAVLPGDAPPASIVLTPQQVCALRFGISPNDTVGARTKAKGRQGEHD